MGGLAKILMGMNAGVASPPTEQQLFDWIKANLSPQLWVNGDSGLADISGNSVPLTFNGASGTPTIVSAQLDTHSIIRFDGSNDAMWWPRKDFKTVFLVLKETTTGVTKWIWMNPLSDVSIGNGQGFWKKNNSDANSLYAYLYIWSPSPVTDGRLVSEILSTGSGFCSFALRADNPIKQNGKGVTRVKYASAVANSTATYAIMGAVSNGDKSGVTGFTGFDVAEFIGFTDELTQDQEYIVHAYLERRYPSLFTKMTFLYSPPTPTREVANPVLDGSIYEDNPSAKQTYAGGPIYDGAWVGAMDKVSLKKMGLFSSNDGVSFADLPLGTSYGGAGSFDEQGINTMHPFKHGSTKYAFVTGISAASLYQLGLKSASAWLGAYTSIQTTPIISLATINSALGKSYVESQMYGMSYIAGEYWILLTCSASHGETTNADLLLVKGADPTALSVVGIILDTTYSCNKQGNVTGWSNDNIEISLGGYGDCRWVEGGSIVYDSNIGKYIMFVTFGNRDINTVTNSKIIHMAMSDDALTWKVLGKPLLTVNLTSWESAAIYCPKILTDVSNKQRALKLSSKYWLYYAALQNTSDPSVTNLNGQTGIAYLDSLIDVLSLP